MKTLRHLIEYGLARFILFIFDTLPYGIACAFARGSANLWWLVDRKRRIIARDNILRSGIETDPKQALVLAKRATQHMALVVVESLRSTQFLGDETWRDHVELDIKPDVLEALENPETGLIMVSGHFGNWEIAAHLLSRYKPVAGITRKMNNPRMEKLIQSRKSRYRFRPIPKYGNNPGRFIDVLKNNEILALLFDQHAGNYGMMIDFFGHPAATHKTAAMLHLVTRTPLCFATCKRVGPMQYVATTSHLIQHKPSGNKKEDIRTILDQLNGFLESAIREAPDQYLWGHRRWRD